MIGIFFVAVLWAVNFNRIIIGVKAGSISLAMKNKDQAREILTTETVKFYEQKVVIVYNDLVWEIFP